MCLSKKQQDLFRQPAEIARWYEWYSCPDQRYGLKGQYYLIFYTDDNNWNKLCYSLHLYS